jgi:hypothetical protein
MRYAPNTARSRPSAVRVAAGAVALLLCFQLPACNRGERSTAVRGSSTVSVDSVSVRTSSETLVVLGAAISEDFFTDEARALLGRVILPSDFASDAPDVVLLGHGLWARLGGSPQLVGLELEVGDAAPRVVGVMPPDFAFPAGVELWFPRRAP